MITTLALALSAVLLPANGEPPADRADMDKPLFLRAYENSSPVIREYRLAGIYGKRDRPFVVSFRFQNGQWNVEISGTGRSPLVLRLDKVYNSIPVNQITVTTDGSDENLIVLIPFGTAHTECFSNGSDIYSQVVVSGSGEVLVEDFRACELKEVNPVITRANGMLLIGTPPR